jgi:hypothetical protein
MAEQKLFKVADDDPRRCQSQDQTGQQCPFRAVDGCTVCPKHGANSQVAAQERQKLHDYRLQKWQLRMDDFAASERITSLRGEIGILRMTLEETLNMCHESSDLLLYSHRIQDLTMKIDKLVNSLAKVEMKAGNLLDKSQALILASQIVELVGQYITDPKDIDSISDGLIELVIKLAGKEAENVEL